MAVDFWFDPVCPYSWTASRWLGRSGERRPLRVRHHVMSLYLLNEHRTDVATDYRRTVEASRGPARVATAAATRFGEEVLADFYTAFGELVFDVWRRPSAREYHEVIRAALTASAFPLDLEDAMESDEHDARCGQPRGRESPSSAARSARPSPTSRASRSTARPQRDPAGADAVESSRAPGCSPATPSSSSSSAPANDPRSSPEGGADDHHDRRGPTPCGPAIDDQRARTAGLLEGLSTEQWDHPSLCDGWTVRHVAAHLTLQQQRSVTVRASSPATPGCCAA